MSTGGVRDLAPLAVVDDLGHMPPTTSGLHGAHRRKDMAGAVGDSRLRTALANGYFTPFGKHILLERKRSAHFLTRAAAAILIAGQNAILTSHTAVRLYGCDAADDDPIHVLVPYKCRVRSRPGLVVHHSAWSLHQVETLFGMPVLSLTHSLAEMLCRAQPRAAFACLEQALAMQPEDNRWDFVDKITECVLRRADRRGYRRATTMLDLATRPTDPTTESEVMLTAGG